MKNRGKGFSLIELLVVLVIISIVISIALLAVGDFGGQRKIKIAAKQFADLIPLIEEKALLQPAILGIKINQQGYQIYQLVNNKWQPINERLYRFRSWPKGSNIQLITEHNVTLPESMPQIILSPAATVTPFSLQFKSDGKVLYEINVKLNGAVSFYEKK